MKINIIAGEATYANLASFESIDQLNQTVRQYNEDFALSKTELAVLNLLHRYSAKYTGVSFLRKGKIGELIGKSRRTIIRVCNRLEALGIIRQHEVARPTDKRQTSNAIVIQPAVVDKQQPIAVDVTPEPSENVTPKKTTSSLKQNNVINNTYQSPYVKFKNAVNYFVQDSKLTNKLYGIYLAQTSFIRHCYESSELLDAGIQAIVATFQATKRKELRNPAGYYHGTLDRMLDRMYFDLVSDIGNEHTGGGII